MKQIAYKAIRTYSVFILDKGYLYESKNKPVVVLLIGMRMNSFWKIHLWLPAAMAMPYMLRELYAKGKDFKHLSAWKKFDNLSMSGIKPTK